MRALRVGVLLLFAAALPAAGDDDPLFLLFPYDYLANSEDARHMYVLGVLDAKLRQSLGTQAHHVLRRCLVRHGVGGIRATLERDVIPASGAASSPMPFVVESAVLARCEEYRGAAR